MGRYEGRIRRDDRGKDLIIEGKIKKMGEYDEE